MAGTVLAATGLFAAATGVPQYFEQKKAGRRAARQQEQANRVSQASAQVENARRRRQAIAQARIDAAQNQAAQSQAVQSSSALSGVQSSLGTQLGANIGTQQSRVASQQNIQNLQQSASDILRKGQERVALLNAVGDTATTAASFAMGGGGFGGGGTSTPSTFVPNSFASQTPGPRGAGGFR